MGSGRLVAVVAFVVLGAGEARARPLLEAAAAHISLAAPAAQEAGAPATGAEAIVRKKKAKATSHAAYVDARAGANVASAVAGTLLGATVGGIGGLVAAIVLTSGVAMDVVGGVAFTVLSYIFLPLAGVLVGGGLGLVLGLVLVNIFYPPYEPGPGQLPQPPAPGQQAQPPAPERPRNTLNLGPLSALFSRYSLEYERVVGQEVSLFVAPIYVRGTRTFTLPEDAFGWGANAGMRLFPGGRAPGGFFVQPQVHAEFLATNRISPTGFGKARTRRAFGAGVLLGQSYLIGNAFLMSLGLGGGMEHFSATNDEAQAPAPRETSGLAFVPLLRANLGVAF